MNHKKYLNTFCSCAVIRTAVTEISPLAFVSNKFLCSIIVLLHLGWVYCFLAVRFLVRMPLPSGLGSGGWEINFLAPHLLVGCIWKMLYECCCFFSHLMVVFHNTLERCSHFFPCCATHSVSSTMLGSVLLLCKPHGHLRVSATHVWYSAVVRVCVCLWYRHFYFLCSWSEASKTSLVHSWYKSHSLGCTFQIWWYESFHMPLCVFPTWNGVMIIGYWGEGRQWEENSVRYNSLFSYFMHL